MVRNARGDVTGAIASVNTQTLEGTPIRSVDQALQGRVAGVTLCAELRYAAARDLPSARGGKFPSTAAMNRCT